MACASIAWAQNSFEVASVKPAQENSAGCSGGPGTADPGMWRCGNVSLANLISLAYNLQRYQFQPVDWMLDSRYDVAARVGPGTTKEQFRQMQQDLLVKRFHFQFHYEPKEMPVSEISVVKRGLLKESAAPAPEQRDFVQGPASSFDGSVHWNVTNVSMEEIKPIFALQLGGPVKDATGLKGRYDLSLSWYREISTELKARLEAMGETVTNGQGGPTFRQAVKDQLGLKLEAHARSLKLAEEDRSDIDARRGFAQERPDCRIPVGNAQGDQSRACRWPTTFPATGGIPLEDVPRQFEKGQHYNSVLSDLSEAQTARVLGALDGSPALDIISARKIEQILFTRKLPKEWNGLYDHGARIIQVNSIRRHGIHFGEEFIAGSSSRMPAATGDRFESMRRVLLHEVAHHLLEIGGEQIAAVIEAAFACRGRNPITIYADRPPEEYFTETWVAYHRVKSTLESFDPVGYK